MKRLVLNPGGHPLANDDLIFLQSEFKEVVDQLMAVYGTTFILTGVEQTAVDLVISGVTIPGYRYSDGWICINGELRRFYQQEIFVDHLPTAFINVNDGAIGDAVLYADGANKSVYYENIAFINLIASPYPLTSLLRKRIGGDAWKQVGAVGQPAYSAGWASLTSPTIHLRYRVFQGYLELRGGCFKNSNIGSTADLIFTLPDAYRPSEACVVATIINDSTDRVAAAIIINTNGTVFVRAVSGSSLGTTAVRFDGIRIPLD